MANVLRHTGPWMAAAVVLVAAFMYWLYSESSSIESSLATADTATTSSLPVIPDTAFASNPQRYSRQRVILRPLKIQERLGRAALTVNLGSLQGYPIILDRPVLEGDVSVVEGDNVAVAGQVYALNDSILDVWSQRGFYEPGNREKLEDFNTFFLADSLDLVFPEGEGEGQQQGRQPPGGQRPRG
jgi:hypothetical protein